MPWRRGRVSDTYTKKSTPRECASLMGARAVPTSTVARAPALQWVMSFMPSFTSCPPYFPMAVHLSTIIWA